MTTQIDKLVDPYIDLGNLLLIDKDPIENLNVTTGEGLLELSQKNTQYLFNKIWSLPRKIVQNATCAQLPESEYDLPREKPIPKPREPTKWERFAKEKGIVKQRKSNKVWDDATKDWKPRYGFKRAENQTKDWLIEIPDQADPYKDFFEEKAQAKNDRVHKQELQRLKNIARRTNGANASLPPQSFAYAASQQKNFNGKGEGRNKGKTTGDAENKPLGLVPDDSKSKEQLTHQLSRAKSATASAGKFQTVLKGEKPPKRTGEKRKFEENEGNTAGERERQKLIFSKLQSKKPKLAENRINAVNEHMIREDRKRNSNENNRERKGRAKSHVDRQQFYQKTKKMRKGGAVNPRFNKSGRNSAKAGMNRKRN